MKKIILYFYFPSKKFEIIKSLYESNQIMQICHSSQGNYIIEPEHSELTKEYYKNLTKEEKLNYFQEYINNNKTLSSIDMNMKDTGLVATMFFGIVSIIMSIAAFL